MEPAGLRVVVLGAGGAARTISVELALSGVKHITIVNRTEERGRQLAALLKDRTPAESFFIHWDSNYKIPEGTDVVVNATSIGLFPSRSKSGASSPFSSFGISSSSGAPLFLYLQM